MRNRIYWQAIMEVYEKNIYVFVSILIEAQCSDRSVDLIIGCAALNCFTISHHYSKSSATLR